MQKRFSKYFLPRKSHGSFSVSCNKWINSVVQRNATEENCPVEDLQLTHEPRKLPIIR